MEQWTFIIFVGTSKHYLRTVIINCLGEMYEWTRWNKYKTRQDKTKKNTTTIHFDSPNALICVII